MGRNPLLEQAINGGEQLTKVLRLLCLSSVVGGGLPPPLFDRYRKMIIAVSLDCVLKTSIHLIIAAMQKYGMQHICTLHNLESANLLVPLVGTLDCSGCCTSGI